MRGLTVFAVSGKNLSGIFSYSLFLARRMRLDVGLSSCTTIFGEQSVMTRQMRVCMRSSTNHASMCEELQCMQVSMMELERKRRSEGSVLSVPE